MCKYIMEKNIHSHPHEVKTDDYTIQGNYFYEGFYHEYRADYIDKNNFTIDKQNLKQSTFEGKYIIPELPIPDGEKNERIYLAEKKK